MPPKSGISVPVFKLVMVLRYKEKLKVKDNSIIITTHHFQKTGVDPIAEWERRTFVVSENGEVELTKHLFKKVGSIEWKTDNEWFNR